MPSLDTKITHEASEIAEQVEIWIDDYINNLVRNEYNKKKRLSSLLKTSRIKKSESKILASWFSNLKIELEEVINENDSDLIEGWDFLTSSKIRKLYEFVCSICDDFESYGKITKKKRKRKPEQIVKSLKYLNSGKVGSVHVTSFDPIDILNCKSFITLNLKTNDMCYYETQTSFDIKGTTVQNFDENQSYCQKIGRESENLCRLVSGSGVAFVMQRLKTFKTKKKNATGRINNSTILLRVLS